MQKLYLVNFEIEGKRCFKVGITSKFDVTERFQRHINSGAITNFKVYKSSYFSTYDEAYEAEQNLMQEIVDEFGGYEHDGDIKFHNFWTKTKLGGVTEIRKYDQSEVSYAWDYINENGEKSYKNL